MPFHRTSEYLLSVCVQTTKPDYQNPGFHRKRTGLGHIAFQVSAAGMVDAFVNDFLKPRQIEVLAKEDFSGVLWCAAGDVQHGRMYRYVGGRKARKDGSKSEPTRRYKCESRGKSVSADHADEALNARMAGDAYPWWIPFAIDPNAERDRALEAVKSELAALPTLGLDEDASGPSYAPSASA